MYATSRLQRTNRRKTNLLKNNGWQPLLADGSKSDYLSPAYIAVDATGQVQINHIVTVEAGAFLQITNLARKDKLKMASIIDSSSVMKAICSHLDFNWNTINKIWHTIPAHGNKMKIFWFARHIGRIGAFNYRRQSKSLIFKGLLGKKSAVILTSFHPCIQWASGKQDQSICKNPDLHIPLQSINKSLKVLLLRCATVNKTLRLNIYLVNIKTFLISFRSI